MRAALQLERAKGTEVEAGTQFARDVRAGLGQAGQKWIPCKYFYDAVGSALFEAISVLPEYGLTRADQRILRRYAGELAAAVSPPLVVAELGSGSGRKTRLILEALARRQPTTYHPIEISAAALALAERELNHLDGVSVRGFEAEYLDGLGRAAARRSANQQLLVLFLGSSIGNFNRNEDCQFLAKIRSLLRAGDALLLGTDLVKPVSQILPAYDDPAGVTAAFNLNLLGRINRELGGNFDLRRFAHEARYNEGEQRVEMHLRAQGSHDVRIEKAGLDIHFDRGETLWTESSYKYTLEDVVEMAEATGFRAARRWVDEEWPFAESLLVAS
ncbi:MAG TPA: L-histidine N(alpha)-methyltransferase [Terriglobia bacterium]|nr:L-histidine N(alpha)-methyltransferase [Terriglobia bacterium]